MYLKHGDLGNVGRSGCGSTLGDFGQNKAYWELGYRDKDLKRWEKA